MGKALFFKKAGRIRQVKDGWCLYRESNLLARCSCSSRKELVVLVILRCAPDKNMKTSPVSLNNKTKDYPAKLPQRYRLLVPALCATGFLLWANTVCAAVLVQYGFGTTSPGTLAPTSVFSGLTASAIAAAPSGINGVGSGWGTGTGGNTFGISTTTGNLPNALFTRGPVEATEGTAHDSARYFSLTLDPDSGMQMSLSSLTFDYFRDSSTSNSAFFLRTDADNFSTTIASGTLSGNGAWTPRSVNLSAVTSLQNLTQAVTLRIYFYGSSTDTRITRYDNFSLNGDMASIPEPGIGLLMLTGLGALVLFRRFHVGQVARL